MGCHQIVILLQQFMGVLSSLETKILEELCCPYPCHGSSQLGRKRNSTESMQNYIMSVLLPTYGCMHRRSAQNVETIPKICIVFLRDNRLDFWSQDNRFLWSAKSNRSRANLFHQFVYRAVYPSYIIVVWCGNALRSISTSTHFVRCHTIVPNRHPCFFELLLFLFFVYIVHTP